MILRRASISVAAVALLAFSAVARHYSFVGGYPASGASARNAKTVERGGVSSGVAVADKDAKEGAQVLEGRVTKVSDGDTIWITSGNSKRVKIRLYGIDAPETDQPWGTESKTALTRKIFGKNVKVVASGRDPYGRVVGTVYLGDEDINGWMIAEGHAWWYKHFAKDEKKWEELAKTAQENKKGLWAKASPINPYEWRKLHKNSYQRGNCKTSM